MRNDFLSAVLSYFQESAPRIQKCLAELSEEELWLRPNARSNSVGNLILHLCGNITQYVISALGGSADARVRDAEFAATGGFTKAELEQKLLHTVERAVVIMENLDEASLLRVYRVQGFQKSGFAIVIHVTEHFSYHTGQITFWVKLLKDKDLGYYSGFDLNAHN